jgi:FkbM family methyltransferase
MIGLLGRAARWGRKLGLGGLVKLLRNGADRGFKLVGFPPLAIEVEGVRLRGFLRHRSFLAHVKRGYEPEMRRHFFERVTPDTTVIDCGAHVGLYTVLASRALGDQGHVHAFEPDAYNFAALRYNTRALGNVTISPKAVSATSGTARLQQLDATVGSSLAKRTDRGPGREVTVETTTLDDAIVQPAARLLIKLDVEGAELDALRGMRSIAERADELTIFFEVNDQALGDFGVDLDELIGELERNRLDLHWIDEESGALVPFASGMRNKCNVLAQRAS